MTNNSDMELTPEDKITKAKIRLGNDPSDGGRPFFSYLISHLKFVEKKDMGTMGVDAFGNCFYDPKFVDSLSDDELVGVLSHEIMHLCLEHITISCELKHNLELANISQDIVVDNIVLTDGMKIPDMNGMHPLPKNNELEINGYKVENIDKKSSYEIYDELYKKFGKNIEKFEKMIRDLIKGAFDKHIRGEGNERDCKSEINGKGNPFRGESDLKNHWRKVLLDAVSHAKNRGSVPGGMERLVGELVAPKVNWKTYLMKYISSMIPMDYTWGTPSKRTISTGIYLPSTEKESIEIITAIDTSSSISQEELKIFISELVSITRSFRNVDLTILDCDADIHEVFNFKQATARDVLDKVKLKGNGGTSHVPVFNWLKKEKPNAKFIICFTDGYTSFPSKKDVRAETLWIVAGENRLEKEKFPFGKVVVVK